jgi:hypothetical protein
VPLLLLFAATGLLLGGTAWVVRSTGEVVRSPAVTLIGIAGALYAAHLLVGDLKR